MSIIRTQILSQALKDYDQELVRINWDLIKSQKLPKEAMGLLPSGLSDAWRTQPVEAIALFIALNSINYMFWELKSVDGKKAFVRYQHDGKVGSSAMTRAFKKVWGAEPGNNGFAGNVIDVNFIKAHFGDMPDPQGRASVLTEIFADGMLNTVAKRIYSIVESNGALTPDEAGILAQAFPRAYGDVYHKKSQLALGMIAGFFAELGRPVDVTQLTGYADYQLPSIFRSSEHLIYSPYIAGLIDSMTIIEKGSRAERALRGATILLMQALAEENGITSAEVDYYAFKMKEQAGKSQHHLTFTEAY